MYDYPSFQTSFDQQRVSSFQNSNQTQNQWKAASQRLPSTTLNPVKLPKEISEELTQRFTMRQKTMTECNKGPSIEIIKRKFEIESPQPKPRSTSTVVSYKKSSNVINNTLEESYWAQWKPTNSSFNTNIVKNETSLCKGRSQFMVNSVSNRCNMDSLTLCDGKKMLEEKSLKVLRKPMAMTESNSSEGDKNIQGKLFLCNPCDNPINQNNSQCYQNYQQPYPTFTASMPNYHSIFYYRPSDHNYHERVKPCKRKESHKRCVKKRDKPPENYLKDIHQSNHRDEDKKRPKTGIAKSDEKSRKKELKCKMSKSNGEIYKNHVRFCTKKYHGESNEESETSCSRKDSTRTIEGYHGDVDTESQMDTRKFKKDCYADVEDTQEMNEDYCYCHCCNKSYWLQDYSYHQSDNPSEHSYSYNPYQIYRYDEELYYPNNYYPTKKDCHRLIRNKNDSNSSFCYDQFKDSSYSSTSKITSKITSSNQQITKRMREKSCATSSPVSRTACACNTEPTICVNKSCETADDVVTKEKRIGDDSPSPGGLKVIKEKPETLIGVSSSSRSDEYQQRDNGCKCCSEAPCRRSLTSTSSSTRPSKSSTPSSRDTIAVAVGSSKDNIQDEGIFVMNDPTKTYCKEKRRSQSTQKCSKVVECMCVTSSGTSTDPVSNEFSSVQPTKPSPRDNFQAKRCGKQLICDDEANITPPSWTQTKRVSDSENLSKEKISVRASLTKSEKSQTADSGPLSSTQSKITRSMEQELNKPGSHQTNDVRRSIPISSARDGNSVLENFQDRPKTPQSTIAASTNPSAVSNDSYKPEHANSRQNSKSTRPELIQTSSSAPGSAGPKPRSHSGSTPIASIKEKSPIFSNAQTNNPIGHPGNRSGHSVNPQMNSHKAATSNPSHAYAGLNSTINRGIRMQPKHFITDSTQTGHSFVPSVNKPTSTYHVQNSIGSTPFDSMKTLHSTTLGATIPIKPELVYSQDPDKVILPRSVNHSRHAPQGDDIINGKYVPEKYDSINVSSEAAEKIPLQHIPNTPSIRNDFPVTREKSVEDILKHGRSYDRFHHYNTHETQIVYRVESTNHELKQHSPKIQGDDVHYGDSYGVFPSDSKNLGYISTPKSLILQRNSRYMPLKGHTYTLKTQSSCSRTWRSPKRKR